MNEMKVIIFSKLMQLVFKQKKMFIIWDGKTV